MKFSGKESGLNTSCRGGEWKFEPHRHCLAGAKKGISPLIGTAARLAAVPTESKNRNSTMSEEL